MADGDQTAAGEGKGGARKKTKKGEGLTLNKHAWSARQGGGRRHVRARQRKAAADGRRHPQGCDDAEGEEGGKVVLEGRGLTRDA